MHLLSISKTGLAEMAYVGPVPWHGLGTNVPKGTKPKEFKKKALMEWSAVEREILFANHKGVQVASPTHKALVRSDNGYQLGIVGKGYKPVQPGDLFDSLTDLTEEGGWHMHTAGALKGGRIIWVMASCDYEGFVKHAWDRVAPNLLIATSLDGSMNTTAKLTMVRAVCYNTVSAALQGEGQEVKIRHNSHFNADEIKESLGVSVHAFKEWLVASEAMAETPVKLDEARELLRSIFGQPRLKDINENAEDAAFQRMMAAVSKTDDQKLVEQRSVDRCLKLFQGDGIAAEKVGLTRWGLFNAITQHVDHERGRTNDTRMEGAWFGTGDVQKAAAFEMLSEDLV